MSTEFQWSDFSPTVTALKWTFKGILGLGKGLAYLLSSDDSPSKQTAKPHDLPIQCSSPCGVVFGKQEKAYIAKPEELDGHVLVVGGVGSGKSSCVAIPTLKAWNQRIFAIDIKGELYEKQSPEYKSV